MNSAYETALLDYTDKVYEALEDFVGPEWIAERDDAITQTICDAFDANDPLDPERLADQIFESN